MRQKHNNNIEYFLEELREYHGKSSVDRILSVASLSTDLFLKKNIRRLTSFYTVEAFHDFLALVNVEGVMEKINPHEAYQRILSLGGSSDAETIMQPHSDFTSGIYIIVARFGAFCYGTSFKIKPAHACDSTLSSAPVELYHAHLEYMNM